MNFKQELQRNPKKDVQLKWDRLCQQAINLREQGMSYKEIAEKIGYSTQSLQKELKKRGLWKGRARAAQEKWDDLCERAQVMRTQGLSYFTIAKKLDCYAPSLREELKKRGLWSVTSLEERKEVAREKWENTCIQAVELHGQGWSYIKIAKKLNCHVTSLRKELKKRGLR